VTDPKRYRCTLVCKCGGEIVTGYGPKIEDAEAEARRHFRRGHGRAKPASITREHAVETAGGSSHYEEI
jgi:hypothetical protein